MAKSIVGLIEQYGPLVTGFETIVRVALRDDPECADLRLGSIAYFPRTGAIRPIMKGVPRGRRVHPHIPQAWMPDRPMLTEFVGRYIKTRSRRWLVDEQRLLRMPPTWPSVLKERWPGKFEGVLAIGPGWVDLVITMQSWLDELGAEVKWRSVHEKLATLRLHQDRRLSNEVNEIVLIAEWLSGCICDECGAPGRTQSDGIGWLSTRCDDHAPPTSD